MSTKWQMGVLDGRILPIYGLYARAGPYFTSAGRTHVGPKWRGRNADILASTKLSFCRCHQILLVVDITKLCTLS